MSKYNTRTIVAHGSVATLQDGSIRPVTTIEQDGRLLLVARHWVGPLFRPVIQMQHPQLASTLDAIMNVADFEVEHGVWTGSARFNGDVLGALAGLNRNTAFTRLAALQREGFIEYVAGNSKKTRTILHIYPVNPKSGLALFQADASWRLSFITKIERKRKLYEAPAPRIDPTWTTAPTLSLPISGAQE